MTTLSYDLLCCLVLLFDEIFKAVSLGDVFLAVRFGVGFRALPIAELLWISPMDYP